MYSMNRREFLTGFATSSVLIPSQSLGSIGAGFCPPSSGGFGSASGGYSGGGSGSFSMEDFSGKVPSEGPPERFLSLCCTHTGDSFSGQYVSGGQYIPEALERLNWVAKDWRHTEPTGMDPRLWDLLHDLQTMIGIEGSQWNISSGYRNPASNASVGGAKQSMHMRAKALDISSPLRPHSAIQGAARAIQQRRGGGGVGSYNSFTHIDTRGSVSTWSG